jgi:prepilin-type N-terminal cleavage/methylation domain-containing protein
MKVHSPLNPRWAGFTLIELLIVIAIILILISIALPNFLEAQVRAKVANAQGELRTLITTTEMYRNDYRGLEPRANIPGAYPTKVSESSPYSSWWGFTSYLLTTPNKYISTIPFEPFSDDFTLGFWTQMHGSEGDPPYTVIRDTMTSMWPVGGNLSNNPKVQAAAGGPVLITRQFYDANKKAGYIYYSSGPDRVDGTVWGSPQFYSPTNGTNSFGDLYQFGFGSPDVSEHKGLK